MVMDPKAAEFRRLADEQGILLRAADEEESRYVFDLQSGAVVTSRHPTLVRQLLLLAEAVYGPDRGEARELSCLIARRLALETPPSTVIVWQSAARAHATAPAVYDRSEWVAFKEWIDDLFLLEDLLAKLDEGVPI